MIYKDEVQDPSKNTNFINAQTNFIFRIRMFWRDLATWLRAYKSSLYGNIGNTNELSQRLFRMPAEYANIIRLFFGDQSAEQFRFLLIQYITVMQDLFTAQADNNIDEINNLTQRAYQVTNEAATYFANINPYWTQGEWMALLNAFTAMQIEESMTFLAGENAKNIDIFDRILSLTTVIGDYFAGGMTDYFSSI